MGLSPHVAHNDPALRDLARVPIAELKLSQRPALAVDVTHDHRSARASTGIPAAPRVMTPPKLDLPLGHLATSNTSGARGRRRRNCAVAVVVDASGRGWNALYNFETFMQMYSFLFQPFRVLPPTRPATYANTE
jgi:hypothetical protein